MKNKKEQKERLEKFLIQEETRFARHQAKREKRIANIQAQIARLDVAIAKEKNNGS